LLDDFGKELESRGLRFVRYADDFLVFTKTRKAAERVFDSAGRYLTRKLKLAVNQQKSYICSSHGVEFLGFEGSIRACYWKQWRKPKTRMLGVVGGARSNAAPIPIPL
tara:strand:- start:4127 stop:4450 length:324 start_codon:yes stop_codon:yes gene_type:complete